MVTQQHKSRTRLSPALSLSCIAFTFSLPRSTSTAPNEPRNVARKVRLMFVVCGINFVYKSFVRTTLPPSTHVPTRAPFSHSFTLTVAMCHSLTGFAECPTSSALPALPYSICLRSPWRRLQIFVLHSRFYMN